MSLRLKKVMQDEQVAPIQKNNYDAEDVETGSIKELSLLGSAYEANSQDLAGEVDAAGPPSGI